MRAAPRQTDHPRAVEHWPSSGAEKDTAAFIRQSVQRLYRSATGVADQLVWCHAIAIAHPVGLRRAAETATVRFGAEGSMSMVSALTTSAISLVE
ncbi:MAG: hypothetical protein AAGB05_17725 [Pseudomonadota bacterium]